MSNKANEFLYNYLNNASPTGFEMSGQKIWLDYIKPYIDDKIDYNLGLAFQNTNNFRQAIKHFEAFRKKNKTLAGLATIRIKQCIFADSLVRNELNVVIENIGSTINSPFEDYAPLISPDGNSLIFTSNREINRNGTHKEDIYKTSRGDGKWNEPEKTFTLKNSSTEFTCMRSAHRRSLR
jgi:hypothetical protein